MRVAALFVDGAGVYSGLDDVEVWDEARDARLYAGPWPVVAHPPCATWSVMGQCRPEIIRGNDGGCFQAALRSVKEWGGVLEHPAHSHAWRKFALPSPSTDGWVKGLWDDGWTIEVDQAMYGHPANKHTWLYYVGPEPPRLICGTAPFTGRTVRNDGGGYKRPDGTFGSRYQRSRTPVAFRDVLLAMARGAAGNRAAEEAQDPQSRIGALS